MSFCVRESVHVSWSLFTFVGFISYMYRSLFIYTGLFSYV